MDEKLLKLFHMISYYNQGKFLSHSLGMGLKHHAIAKCVEPSELNDDQKKTLERAFNEFVSFGEKNLEAAIEKNIAYIKKFFGATNRRYPRICIKVSDGDKIKDLYRDDRPKTNLEFDYRDNSGFEWCVEKGMHFFCNDLVAAINNKGYKNPRIGDSSAQNADLNHDSEWIKLWSGYSMNEKNADLISAYKSTLIIPISLNDSYISKELRNRLDFNDSDQIVWGYLCLDSIDKNFFREETDPHFGYIIANFLSQYFVINANFTIYSKSYNKALSIIKKKTGIYSPMNH